jgi:hypothetical protein
MCVPLPKFVFVNNTVLRRLRVYQHNRDCNAKCRKRLKDFMNWYWLS